MLAFGTRLVSDEVPERKTLPGVSILKWKIYAVLSNAAAGLAVFALTLTLGLSRRAAWFASPRLSRSAYR